MRASAGTDGAEVFAVMGFGTTVVEASKRPVTLAGVVTPAGMSALPWAAIAELPAVPMLGDVVELVCPPGVFTTTGGPVVGSPLGLVGPTVSLGGPAARRPAMLTDEDATLAVAAGSSTARDLLCGADCGDFDDVGIDTDPAGLESAGDAESGATAPVRSHSTERGVAWRR
jgi:hypothetical protein